MKAKRQGMATEQNAAQRSVKSAERVLDILEFVGPRAEGASFTQIGAALSIPKSSLHALLDALVQRGYLEIEAERRRYRLGVRVWEAGQAYPRHHDVIEVARAVLRDVVGRVNETAQLARLSGRDNVYLAKEESSHPLRLQSETGSRLPAHATGVGKALLAQMPREAVAGIVGGPDLQRFTPTTHATLAELSDELAETRRRGFAVDNAEYTPGVFCLAVPVVDRSGQASLALSVSLPVIRLSRHRLAAILEEIARGSLAISQRIGAPRADATLSDLARPGAGLIAIDALFESGRYLASLSE
jgi:DNA-binding IclR family transcriptional regulator